MRLEISLCLGQTRRASERSKQYPSLSIYSLSNIYIYLPLFLSPLSRMDKRANELLGYVPILNSKPVLIVKRWHAYKDTLSLTLVPPHLYGQGAKE